MNRLYTILMIFLVVAAFSRGAAFAKAQEAPEDIARKYQITFPIAQLGGCANIGECRNYCEDPVHSDTCIAFAKTKGFYKETQMENRKTELLETAKTELGCNSPDSCREVCEKEENFEKCSAFAKKNNISGGHTANTGEQRVLEKAKQILGCDSPSTCKSFCENEQNREKCTQFAQEAGMRGGERMVGPGGCTSEETCKTFCSDPANYQVCSSFGDAKGREFKGPGGCTNEESCKAYCEQNPKDCGFERREEMKDYNPQEMCSKTPNCSWVKDTNRCQCKSSFGGEGNYLPPPGTIDTNASAATECAKYPGCSWAGTTCQCGSNPQSGQPPNESPPDPMEQCTRNGCQWTNNTCQCSGTTNIAPPGGEPPPPPPGNNQQTTTNSTSPDPATECAKHSGCSWTGSTCQCSSPEVQGAQTAREGSNFIQLILGFFFGE